jgi:hypothetical protein
MSDWPPPAGVHPMIPRMSWFDPDDPPPVAPIPPPIPPLPPAPPRTAAAPRRRSQAAPGQPIVEFAREACGIELYPRQAQLLSELYHGGSRVNILRLGRRSGKTLLASIVAVYEGTVRSDEHRRHARPGETLEIVCVATEINQARLLRRAIGQHFDRPALRGLVKRETESSVELKNGFTISALATNARSLRGRAIPVLVLDEFAHLVDSTGSAIAAEEIWSSTVPSVAQFPSAKVLVTSTPRWSTGLFFELCEQAASGLYDMATWHASTAEMNPAIGAEVLAAEAERDPGNYRREFLAEWDSGIGSLFDIELVRQAVRRGPDALPPRYGLNYVISSDPAYTGDRWAIVVGHREQDRVVVDLVTGFAGSRGRPVDHELALGTIASLADSYNKARVITDQGMAQPIIQGLTARGVQVELKPWHSTLKLDAATSTRTLLMEGRLEIPGHKILMAELAQLEQHPLPSGRPRIEAPRSSHDDFAVALMALCHALVGGYRIVGEFSMSG